LNKTFYHQTVTYDDIINYINKESDMNLSPVFDQYLRYKGLPTLQFTWQNGKPYCKWIADARGFNMPVRVRVKGGEYKFITPTTTLQAVDLPGATKDNLEADTFNYYIKLSGIQRGG
ncbi:MAG: family metallopeptidase, partial [Mucilaginibacter sp.]|nr:family metallopeptidase [Mucilaginibacter sp.]